MQAKFAANKSQQQHELQQSQQLSYNRNHNQQEPQQQHSQAYLPIENGTNDLDQQINTSKSHNLDMDNVMNMQSAPHQQPYTNELDHTNSHRSTPTGMGALQHQNIPPSQHEFKNGPRKILSNTTASYGDLYRLQTTTPPPPPPSSLHGKITSDIVQYDSFNVHAAQRVPQATITEADEYIGNGTNDFQMQQQLYNQQLQYQPYRSPSSLAFSENSSMNMENGLKPTIDSDIQLHDTTPMEIETNHNNIHNDATSQVKTHELPEPIYFKRKAC